MHVPAPPVSATVPVDVVPSPQAIVHVCVSAVPDEKSSEVGGLQNTFTNLGASVGTAEFKMNVLLRAEGDALIARATVIHTGKIQAVCRCEVFLVGPQGERLCASAQGTVVRKGAD